MRSNDVSFVWAQEQQVFKAEPLLQMTIKSLVVVCGLLDNAFNVNFKIFETTNDLKVKFWIR
jgi:hypothetical protein